jgi:hypothetical protein
MDQNNKGGNPTLLVGSLTQLTNTNIRKNTVTACPMQGFFFKYIYWHAPLH